MKEFVNSMKSIMEHFVYVVKLSLELMEHVLNVHLELHTTVKLKIVTVSAK